MDIGIAQSKQEKAVLEHLSTLLQQGHKLLAKQDINLGYLKLAWDWPVRAQLRKIYGPEALRLFPQLEGKSSPESVPHIFQERITQLENFLASIKKAGVRSFGHVSAGKVFMGHGRSLLWRELKDFISERLSLPWVEFNREPVAGLTTFERVSTMLDEAGFAFLIMTAEDEHADATLHARENVIHEVGLFQGRLGPRKAIILLEEGCKEFSNIVGLSQIRFPKGYISAIFEDVRRVLEREGILDT